MDQPLPRNVKLTIEYDGTAYHGWQRQANTATVQQVLEDGIAEIVGHPVTLHASGRTDAGVHALGQIANFHTDSTIPAERLHHAINTVVSMDIAVLRAEDVPDGFHARYSAAGKTYRYAIVCRPVRPAVGAPYVHWLRREPDLPAMQAAAGHLVGEHDFAAFETESGGGNTVRTVTRAEWVQEGQRLYFWVAADGFLYNMVRAMVGTLLEVGLGKRSHDDIPRLLAARDRARAGPTAPAKGLCLMRVEYRDT
ncbi:MAG: tRNA pseudouridine(38-40) synthase TruA [Planctomycetota bacterium]